MTCRDRDETCRLQGVARTLIEIIGLPDRLDAEIIAEKHYTETIAGAATFPRVQGY